MVTEHLPGCPCRLSLLPEMRYTGRAAAVRNISTERRKWDTQTADKGKPAALLFEELWP